MILIPTEFAGESHIEQRTALSGRDYVLRFDWNQRDGHWFLGLYQPSGAPIITGLKLVVNWPLLGARTETLRPPGELLVVDTRGLDEDPGFADLGVRHALIYVEPGDAA
jgi:hypothetical protein